jgi:hypothetical protein
VQAEVGGQVDDLADPAPDFGDDLLRCAVRQPEEHEVEAVAGGGVEAFERGVAVGRGQARVEPGDAAAGLGVARGDAHVERGVLGAETQ